VFACEEECVDHTPPHMLQKTDQTASRCEWACAAFLNYSAFS